MFLCVYVFWHRHIIKWIRQIYSFKLDTWALCMHTEVRFPPVDFVTYFMTNGVKWDFDIIKRYNLRAIRVDTITFKDALSHNDLNCLVLDEVYTAAHQLHKEEDEWSWIESEIFVFNGIQTWIQIIYIILMLATAL